MSKFNQNQKPTATEKTYEGGLNYIKDPLEEWVNFLFSSYVENGFYESAKEQLKRYSNLTAEIAEKYGWEFVAKASFFARNYLGMRSISQLTAAILNDVQFQEKRSYFKNFFHRPDDVAEVFSIIENNGSKRSHALVRGAADYLSSLNAYSLGKYKMKGKQYNLYDLINITHAYSSDIDAYKKNCLPVVDTWETAISTSTSENKSKEWRRLVEEHKLGYLALLRNLRNILNCTNVDVYWLEKHVCPQIENKEAIEKSLVFPYQIYQAYRSIPRVFCIENSLEKAFRIACKNVPKLEGVTTIILDVSGSMENPISSNSQVSIKQAGAVFAAMLYINNKNEDIHFIKFGNYAKVCSFNSSKNIFTVIDDMCENEDCGYGTDIVPAFSKMNWFTDRVFIISDMQVMEGRSWSYYNSGSISCFKEYKKKYNLNCKCYSFDLGNYHNQVCDSGDKNVYLLTALNEKIFDFIRLLDNDKSCLVDMINEYNYC